MYKTKEDLEKIRNFCLQNSIDFLGIFGSVVRGDAKENSDVDILVRYKNGNYPSLFKKSDLVDGLERHFGKKVDLVAQEFIDPLIRESIYSNLKSLYGNP